MSSSVLSKVTFHSSGLSGPTNQFLNGTHVFSQPIVAKMALGSVLLLRSAKVPEFGELWHEKCTRAAWTFPFKLARTSSFRPARTNKKATSERLGVNKTTD